MKLIYFVFICLVCFASCKTIVEDEPEIEKVLEDATKEVLEEVIEHG